MPDRPNAFYDSEAVERRVAAGEHRELVGGGWHEVGQAAFDFLLLNGLKPSERVLDVGCGALRVGIKLVPYLEPRNYYGIDLVESLIEAGYEREIVPAGLAARLPRENLRTSGDFEAAFAAPIDVAIAFSVFSHLPFNHLRWCLDRLTSIVRPGGRFFVTYFELPDEASFAAPAARGSGIVTYPGSDPYHYYSADIAHAAYGTQWLPAPALGWPSTRAQKMALFIRR